MFSHYYAFDNVSPIKSMLHKAPYNLTENQWSSFFTAYAIPNVLLPLFGGMLIDQIGTR